MFLPGERWSKRARRSRTTAGAATDGADSSERDSERHAHNTTHKKGKHIHCKPETLTHYLHTIMKVK